MKLNQILDCLLQVGQAEKIADIGQLPELSPNMAVVLLLDRNREGLAQYAKNLSENERISLIKSIAILEHQVGSRGSVTHLKRLLSFVSDKDKNLLDWILRNTTSYWYYAHGARSIEEYELFTDLIASRASERAEREKDRQVQDSSRIAATATVNMYNAIRRGDVKAVRALLGKGANIESLTPDGVSFLLFAESLGNIAITTELRNALASDCDEL